MYEAIPQELKALRQWVCWRFADDPSRPGKRRKLPLCATTGEAAKSNDPATWAYFDEAQAYAPDDGGIGFMFSGGYFGVDIDGIEDDIMDYRAGGTDNIVAEFVYSLGSYAEYSVSGNGIHIICRGVLPPAGRRRGNVEMYENGRFFVMTGRSAADYTELSDCTKQIKALHEKYIQGGRLPTIGKSTNAAISGIADDGELLQKAFGSKQGKTFQDLYEGHWDNYFTSQSEADMSLCNRLAFWTGRSEARMDRLFRASGLMRPKWDRPQSGSTYGKLTIAKACAECATVYNPKNDRETYTIHIGSKPEKPDTSRYTLDDTGNAARLFDAFGAVIRYCYPEKRWYWFDSRRWCEDRSGTVRGMADEVVEAMRGGLDEYLDSCGGGEEVEKAYMKHLKHSRSQNAKSAMIASCENLVPVLPEELDSHRMLLNTPAGVIDLKSGQIAPHNAKLMLTKLTNSEYSDRADSPVWDKFLLEIFEGDRELIRYVQKAVGYSLTGSTDEQCMFFCVGDGQNGKSTFLETIAGIMGDYSANVQAKTLMVRGQSDGSSDIARLKGPRFVTCVEPAEGARLDEGLIKQLTGGDRVTARRLYADEMEFVPQFKLWMGTNHKPIIRGTDFGIWRRLRIIPFGAKIPPERIDRRLRWKLMAEYPAILRWAVDGCLLWQRGGLEMPACVARGVNDYKNEMDVISAFLAECTVACGECRSSELYRVYAKWAKESNEYCMSATKFGRELGKRFESRRGNGQTICRNISLNEQYRPYAIKLSLA